MQINDDKEVLNEETNSQKKKIQDIKHDSQDDGKLSEITTGELEQVLKESNKRISFTEKILRLLKIGVISVEQVQLLHWTGRTIY